MKKIVFFTLLFVGQLLSGQQTNVTLDSVQTSNVNVKATNSITLLPGFHVGPTYTFSARIIGNKEHDNVVGNPYNLNENLNWISSSTYDASGRLTSSGVSYFNTLGKATQRHSLDIKTGKIWVSETRYDQFGRGVFHTLSAPVGTSFGYRKDFIKKSDNSNFTSADLINITDNTATAIIGNQPNTLGLYYSNLNNSEPYQDITAHPYSRTVYSTLNPGKVLKTLGGNKVKRTPKSARKWLQSHSFSMPMAQELFYAFGKDKFPKRKLVIAKSTSPPPTEDTDPTVYFLYDVQLCGTTTTQSHVRLLSREYELVIGKTYKMKVNNVEGYYTIMGKKVRLEKVRFKPLSSSNRGVLIDVKTYDQCPQGRPYYVEGNKTVVRDVHGVETVIFTDSEGKVLASARSGNEDNRNRKKYKVLSPIGEQGYVDIHIPVGCGGRVSIKGPHALYKVYDLITERLITTHASPGNSPILQPGFYRFEENKSEHHKKKNPYITISGNSIRLLDANHNIGVEYYVNYYDYSLNFYDKSGRLTKSVQPLGFDNRLDLSPSRNHKLSSEFSYNSLGQLLYTKSTDEGEAWFKYRKDGQIRFSQNSKQKKAGEFSYTNYDVLGRPTESGVTVGNFTKLDPNVKTFSGNRKEQNFTIYDEADAQLQTILVNNGASKNRKQTYLEGNVSKTYTQKPQTSTTWYSYDIYGRVKWMIQKIEGVGIKTIDYEYDFATGLVTKVIYQKHVAKELFVHRYTHNVTGQLYKVETSTNNRNFSEQAKYKYYETGALKRVELAENIQGIDYIYNLSGQLKAMNHPSTNTSDDPGQDGKNGFAKDLFGFALDYYNGDYARTNTPTKITSTTQGVNLFNGNIKATRWTTNSINNGVQAGQLYQYNKNNWLTEASFGTAQNNGNITIGTDYKVSNITYDANGNIQTLNRNKNTTNGSNAMDAFSYKYKRAKPNQLDHIDDSVTIATNVNDLKDQNSGNYLYNSIGQLTENVGEGVKYIYNASGLVTEVQKNKLPLVKFYYDDKGFRVKKEAYVGAYKAITWYVRDASGNPMAIINQPAGKAPNTEENPIYGNSRIGMFFRADNSSVYQLTDHLGNVRAVVSKKTNGNATALVHATDYYPFGMPMPNRQIIGGKPYRYGYQGNFSEKDEEIGLNSFERRFYDSRLMRWLTPDDIKRSDQSPYMGMGNNPILYGDPDGRDIIILNSSMAVGGLGHAAALIGNDKDGWRYISKNGTENHGLFGSSHSPDLGNKAYSFETGKGSDFRGTGLTANQVMRIVNKQYMDAHSEGGEYYDNYIRVQTTKEQDEIAYKAAYKEAKEYYSVCGASCVDVPQNALMATQKKFTKPNFNNILPNEWFINFGWHNNFRSYNTVPKPLRVTKIEFGEGTFSYPED